MREKLRRVGRVGRGKMEESASYVDDVYAWILDQAVIYRTRQFHEILVNGRGDLWIVCIGVFMRIVCICGFILRDFPVWKLCERFYKLCYC